MLVLRYRIRDLRKALECKGNDHMSGVNILQVARSAALVFCSSLSQTTDLS